MKNNVLLGFALTFVIVAVCWVATDELELRGKISHQTNNIVSIIVWGGSLVYWLLKYARQEKWF